jgi:hypothetical protein
MTSCAAFIKKSRMNFVEPIALNRKSGGVEGSAASFPHGLQMLAVVVFQPDYIRQRDALFPA